MIKKLFLVIVSSFVFLSCGDDNSDAQLSENQDNKSGFIFSNYSWTVKETKNIADSRYFCLTSKENVRIDENGTLVLKLSKKDGVWVGGEITIDTTLGFGEYSFDASVVSGEFDANATLAFTVLNITDDYYEGMTQTGIRFTKYSEPDAANELEYFLYATDKKFAEVQTPDNPFLLSRMKSSHKIGVYPNYLYYSSKSGAFYNEFKAIKKGNSITDLPDAITFSDPTNNLKVIISLCLAEANETVSGKEIEVLISNFKFSPSVDDITKK